MAAFYCVSGGDEMKTLLIVCSLIMVFGVSLAQAQQYEVALAGTKIFTTNEVVYPGGTIGLDIWLTNAAAPQNAGGAWLDFSGSVDDIAYVSAGRAFQDGSEGVVGPWTNGAGVLVNEPAGPGTLMIVVGNLGGAAPDDDGDIIVGTVTLQGSDPGANDATVTITTIPSVATWTPIDDTDVSAGLIVIMPIGCPTDSACDDGLFCTGQEYACACSCCPGTPPCDDGDPCTIDVCDEDQEACLDKECDEAYALSNQAECASREPCASVCCGGDFQLIKESGYYQPPSEPGQVVTIKNKICLNNWSVLVGGIQFDICDTPDCLTCIDCELTERTVMFDCAVLELPDGCCRVIMFCKNPGCAINPGECDIVTVVMQTNGNPDCGEDCIIEEITNIIASDYDGFQLLGNGVAGFVCPVVCGDVCPPGSGTANDCGDGVVDIYDIMCEVDLALTATIPNDCQLPRADVPTGTPPNCFAPDGDINILDIMVLIDMALNRQDCCSFYYQGIIY
jgi:hypothetical protein